MFIRSKSIPSNFLRFSRSRAVLLAAGVLILAGPACAEPPKPPSSVHELTVDTIEGKKKKLADYKGKVLLVVNTASKCGYTPQYAGLQKLHTTHQKAGLVVLGFPSNDFGGQEPGTSREIKDFCESRFQVSFPLFAKVHAKGDSKAPLYRVLTETGPKATRGEVRWNFTKFLVDRSGKVIARFAPGTTPEDPTLVKAVKEALAAR